MDDTFAQLEALYCPPLDPALVSAILSDYDLGDQHSVRNAKETLDQLKEDALVEEAAGFDPSGTGAADGYGVAAESESRPDTSTSRSQETVATSLSHGVSSLDLTDEPPETDQPIHIFDEPEGFEELDEDAKVKRLQGFVGDHVNQYSIKYALRKCDGNWDAAIEELLTHAFLTDADNGEFDSVVSAKGIDAFSEENIARRGRKGKTKNRRLKNLQQQRSSSLPGLRDAVSIPAPNKWTSAANDIDFIATRSGISTATVSSTYYQEGASVPRTIAALLKVSITHETPIIAEEPAVSSQVRDLGRDFTTISPDYLAALVRLTRPSTTAARDLAEALTRKAKDINVSGLQVITNWAPAEGVDLDSNWNTITRNAKSAASSRSPSLDVPSATGRRDTYAIAQAMAFSKASAAHRKSKSDRLMGGAAAYYSQVGRDYAALSSSASAEAADALVASQSTPQQLDLHGVDVLNAVRIAQEKVEEWWGGLGESRVNGRIGADERQGGYRVVVGLGRHSEGGKGKLGPAVTKKLMQEGWRVEQAGAVIVVRGRLKR